MSGRGLRSETPTPGDASFNPPAFQQFTRALGSTAALHQEELHTDGFVSDCPACGGKGKQLDEQGKVVYCRCFLEHVLVQRMRLAGFTDPEFRNAAFNLEPDVEAHLATERLPWPERVPDDPHRALKALYDFTPIDLNAFLQEFSDKLLQELPNPSRSRNLLLFGPPGSGKTYSAAAIARRLFVHGFTPYFTTMENLVDCLFNARRDPEAERWRQRYLHADLLVLDEIGYEHHPENNSYVLSKITEFLRFRFRAKLPVVGTSNLLITELAELYGADNMSIFHEYIKIAVTKPEDHRRIRARDLLQDFDQSRFVRGKHGR